MDTGKMAWFNTTFGYGFINHHDGRQVFVHHSVIKDKSKTLKRGDSVKYSYIVGYKGLKAVSVEAVEINAN